MGESGLRVLAFAARLIQSDERQIMSDDPMGRYLDACPTIYPIVSEERLQERKLRKLSHVSRRSRALLGPLNGLLVDG